MFADRFKVFFVWLLGFACFPAAYADTCPSIIYSLSKYSKLTMIKQSDFKRVPPAAIPQSLWDLPLPLSPPASAPTPDLPPV